MEILVSNFLSYFFNFRMLLKMFYFSMLIPKIYQCVMSSKNAFNFTDYRNNQISFCLVHNLSHVPPCSPFHHSSAHTLKCFQNTFKENRPNEDMKGSINSNSERECLFVFVVWAYSHFSISTYLRSSVLMG